MLFNKVFDTCGSEYVMCTTGQHPESGYSDLKPDLCVYEKLGGGAGAFTLEESNKDKSHSEDATWPAREEIGEVNGTEGRGEGSQEDGGDCEM